MKPSRRRGYHWKKALGADVTMGQPKDYTKGIPTTANRRKEPDSFKQCENTLCKWLKFKHFFFTNLWAAMVWLPHARVTSRKSFSSQARMNVSLNFESWSRHRSVYSVPSLAVVCIFTTSFPSWAKITNITNITMFLSEKVNRTWFEWIVRSNAQILSNNCLEWTTCWVLVAGDNEIPAIDRNRSSCYKDRDEFKSKANNFHSSQTAIEQTNRTMDSVNLTQVRS